MKINEVKQKIQGLVDKATSDDERQKKILKFLFDKLNEIRELETIDRLRKFQGGNKYLSAYFTYKSIVRSNYQIELTKHANYENDERGQDKLLEAINADIEQFEKEQEKRAAVPVKQPSNELLLMLVGGRLASNEIKRELTDFGNFLIYEGKKGMIKVDLYDGKITPDPADTFLKKRGLLEKKDGTKI